MKSANSGFADARKQRTREALRAALLEILAEKPFDEIQILDLTGRAGVGYATFFRHYPGTTAVLDEVAGDQIRELLEMTIPVLRQFDSAASVKALCDYIHARRGLWRTLLTGGAAHRVRSEFVRQARAWSRRADDGRPMPVPLDLGTVCAAGSTLDALAWWLDEGQSYAVEDMARYIDRLIITPFVGGK